MELALDAERADVSTGDGLHLELTADGLKIFRPRARICHGFETQFGITRLWLTVEELRLNREGLKLDTDAANNAAI